MRAVFALPSEQASVAWPPYGTAFVSETCTGAEPGRVPLQFQGPASRCAGAERGRGERAGRARGWPAPPQLPGPLLPAPAPSTQLTSSTGAIARFPFTWRLLSPSQKFKTLVRSSELPYTKPLTVQQC